MLAEKRELSFAIAKNEAWMAAVCKLCQRLLKARSKRLRCLSACLMAMQSVPSSVAALVWQRACKSPLTPML